MPRPPILLPTPRLLALALGAAAPLALASLAPAFLYLAPFYLVALGALVVADARATPSADALEASRRHDARLSIGAANPIELDIHWRGRVGGRPRRLWARDETPPGIPPPDGVL